MKIIKNKIMNITVQKSQPPEKILRKLKIKNLNNNNKKTNIINYNWKIIWEYNDENIQDFQLFCISIVKDLIKNDFKTNEHGVLNQKKLKNVNNKKTLKHLKKLYDNIICEQNKNK